jgi:hypothetical protein
MRQVSWKNDYKDKAWISNDEGNWNDQIPNPRGACSATSSVGFCHSVFTGRLPEIIALESFQALKDLI